MEGLEMARKKKPVAWAGVYLVQFGEFVKVGVTNDPEARLRVFQTGLPIEVTMPFFAVFPKRADAMRAEKDIHRLLYAQHERGEWFRASVDDAIAAYEKAAPKATNKPVISMPLEECLLLANTGQLARRLKQAWAEYA
jgi:hypothetical protein